MQEFFCAEISKSIVVYETQRSAIGQVGGFYRENVETIVNTVRALLS
jgi:hypothetical protein